MPEEVTYGRVVGRFLESRGLGTSSTPPVRIAATGYVVFEPLVPLIYDAATPPATVTKARIKCPLDADGDLSDGAGNKGVWLASGQYKVSYRLSKANHDTYRISVSSINTSANPVDLTVVAPLPDPSPFVVRVTTPSTIPFSYTDELMPTLGTQRLYNDSGRPLTITSVRASVAVPPSGQPILIDVNIDGVSIFTDQNNRPTILPGEDTDLADAIDNGIWTPNSYITVDIDQVGAPDPGQDLTVNIVVTG